MPGRLRTARALSLKKEMEGEVPLFQAFILPTWENPHHLFLGS